MCTAAPNHSSPKTVTAGTSSTGEWGRRGTPMQAGYYSATEKNEMVSSAATWTDLEMIRLSAVSQRKDTV